MKSSNREVALAVSLIFLVLHLKVDGPWLELCFSAMIAGILVPVLFTPVTKTLLKVGPKVQIAASPIILNLIFFAVVVPVGLLRKLGGKEAYQHSAKVDKKFSPADIERPF